MLSCKEIWLEESERVEIKKKIKDVNINLQELYSELKFQPANRVYVNNKIDYIINKLKAIKEE